MKIPLSVLLIINMSIKNIEDLKKSINQSTIIIFIAILILVLVALYITHNKFIQKRGLLNQQKIITVSNIYKSNLSEKLSIIASSTVFLDYLRSGLETRRRLYPRFLLQMSSLNSKSISGMQLIDQHGKNIFNYGEVSNNFIHLKLCYLNQTLDPVMGDCGYSWKLFIQKDNLIKEILSINKDIMICKNCVSYDFFNGNNFGSFPVKISSYMKLYLGIKNENDYYFYTYIILIIIALLLFGSWSWYRLSGILNRHIANPIKQLAWCLKNNTKFEQGDSLEEIQFLINEINTWKNKLNKIQADEHSAKLGKIAAQLAHDVRSPLSAIDMLVHSLTNVSEHYRLTLHKAVQRISDIANNFLSQYKISLLVSPGVAITNEYIPSILEHMVSEKRSQYSNTNIQIDLLVADDSWDVFSLINAADFKRVLSNLINNSIESIKNIGCVNLRLFKNNELLHIEINDDGCGIPEHFLPVVIAGGVSIGKKNGSGLGLSHAINKIKEWNGSFTIESKVKIGTKIKITLPLSMASPDWFQGLLKINGNAIICILDNEPYAHVLWNERFLKWNVPLKHFYKSDEMAEFIKRQQGDNMIFLIDYDLGCSETGLDIIEKFNLNKVAMLVSNRYDDALIQKKCDDLHVGLIPKSYIPHIPIFYDNEEITKNP